MVNTAFVTGATGFVGINLVRQLAMAGWKTTILCRRTSNLQDLGDIEYHICRGDITAIETLRQAMPEGVDAVFHVAASTNIWTPNNREQTRINIDGAANVLQVARECGARRYIHTSTFAVWGFQPRIFDETTPVLHNADWINYVRTKRQAEALVEQAIQEHDLDAVMLHPAHILGPCDRHNWSRMIRMVEHGNLPGIPPGGGVFADVRQVAAAHIQAFHQGGRGEHYLLGGERATYVELIRLIGAALQRTVPGRATPAWLLRVLARMQDYYGRMRGREPDITPEGVAMITHHLHCDSSKAQRELGYSLTPLPQLVNDTCAWMRDNGLLEHS